MTQRSWQLCLALALVSVFIFLGTSDGVGATTTEEFWESQTCGHKEVETDQPPVPKAIIDKLDARIAAGKMGFSAANIDGRVYTFGVYCVNMPRYHVHEVKVFKGGRKIYWTREKFCGKH